MADPILDYRYDRTKCPKETMDYLYSCIEIGSLVDGVLVTDETIDFKGIGHTGRNRLTQKDLKGRMYVVFWHLSGEIGIVWLDEVVLPSGDPRGGQPIAGSGGITNIAPTSELSDEEGKRFTRALNRYVIPTHPDDAKPKFVDSAP